MPKILDGSAFRRCYKTRFYDATESTAQSAQNLRLRPRASIGRAPEELLSQLPGSLAAMERIKVPGFARKLSKVGPDAKYEPSSAEPAAPSIDTLQAMPDQGELRRPMSLTAGALEAANHISFDGGSEAPSAENRRASVADDDRSSRHSADRKSVGSTGLDGVLGSLADVDTSDMGLLERVQCADTTKTARLVSASS